MSTTEQHDKQRELLMHKFSTARSAYQQVIEDFARSVAGVTPEIVDEAARKMEAARDALARWDETAKKTGAVLRDISAARARVDHSNARRSEVVRTVGLMDEMVTHARRLDELIRALGTEYVALAAALVAVDLREAVERQLAQDVGNVLKSMRGVIDSKVGWELQQAGLDVALRSFEPNYSRAMRGPLTVSGEVERAVGAVKRLLSARLPDDMEAATAPEPEAA